MRANNLRAGKLILHNGKLYRIRDFQHITPGKGQAVVQTKLDCVTDGGTAEVRFRADEDVQTATIEAREATYLYQDGDQYYFMDTETYEQSPLTAEFLGDAAPYLQEDMSVKVEYHEGSPVGIELPMSVVLEVVETDPPMKGATASGSNKPAKLENGITITIPPYIETGTKVKVDTRTSTYIERV